MNRVEELFNSIIDKAIQSHDTSTFYRLVAALASYDNNLTDSDLKINLDILQDLIKVLKSRDDVADLRKIIPQVESYIQRYKTPQ